MNLRVLVFGLIFLFVSLGFSKQTKQNHNLDAFQKIFSSFESAKDGKVLVVAHRGDWLSAPENSLLAIQNCIDMGVDIVEIDIRKTSDGHLILMHDKSVDRTTNGTGDVSSLTFAVISRLKLKMGKGGSKQKLTTETVPTLEDAMTLVRGKCMVNLDKCYIYFSEAYAILKKTDTINHAIFKGTESKVSVAEKIFKFDPKPIYMPKISSNKMDALNSYLQEGKIQAAEIHFRNFRQPIISAKNITKMKEHDVRAWVNFLLPKSCPDPMAKSLLVRHENNWKMVLARGVTMIQTDYPEILIKYLRERKLHK